MVLGEVLSLFNYLVEVVIMSVVDKIKRFPCLFRAAEPNSQIPMQFH